MKPTPYELLRAFLYAENTSQEVSWIPDETYLQIRSFIQRTEKITDSGVVWHSGKEIYDALEKTEKKVQEDAHDKA